MNAEEGTQSEEKMLLNNALVIHKYCWDSVELSVLNFWLLLINSFRTGWYIVILHFVNLQIHIKWNTENMITITKYSSIIVFMHLEGRCITKESLKNKNYKKVFYRSIHPSMPRVLHIFLKMIPCVSGTVPFRWIRQSLSSWTDWQVLQGE